MAGTRIDQGMLDMLTIHREAPRPFEELSVAIIGDIKHSSCAQISVRYRR